MRRARRGRPLIALAVALTVVAIGTVAGLVIGKRLETGEWKLPTGDDVVRIRRMVSRQAEPPPPPRIIYLHRGPIRLVGGTDDAAGRRSSVVASAGAHTHAHAHGAESGTGSATAAPPPAPAAPHEVALRGFRGSKKSWQRIVTCVDKLFAPFDVVVTDSEPPPGERYLMAVVGGRPRDIGHQGRVGGLAPFSGEVVSNAIVFAFSDALGNRVRATCEVIGMEVAHAFGLDHAYHCKDVMTYLSGCGAKAFRDADVRCGESKPRECHGGAATQNSYRHLMSVLGPAGAATPASGGGGAKPTTVSAPDPRR
jgi:hypothetical protein